MNIIFISFWGLNDPLTISTVNPNINILIDHPQIKSIHFFTIERTNKSNLKENKNTFHKKVIHHPIYEKNNYLSKALTPLKIFARINRFLKSSDTFIIARSSLAAIPAYFSNLLYKTNFSVESYEPHSSYMLDNGVWSKFGLKYTLLKHIENKIERTAYRLFPVSENFKRLLINKGIPEKKILVMPCSVNQIEFGYNLPKRNEIRSKLNLSDDCNIGINVGKFGGIYYNKESLQIFKQARQAFKKFHLILLSPERKSILTEKLIENGFNLSEFTVLNASFTEVPNYLSAADFAFALIKPTKSSPAMSPIKIGEYYASGLPIAITPDIGDDSDIIFNENVGEVINPSNVNEFLKIKELLKSPDHRLRISSLALKYRSLTTNQKVYNTLLKDILK